MRANQPTTRLRWGLAVLCLTGWGLIGCGGPPPVDLNAIGYQQPAAKPGMPDDRKVEAQPATLAAAAATLSTPVAVAQTDPVRGFAVFRYSGDPAPYIDCGTLYADGGAVPAASPQAQLSRFAAQRDWRALRQMRLDARVVARFKGEGGATLIITDATYVVIRTTDTVDGNGAVIGTRRDTIDFESGGTGRFGKGTVCQPNGDLERRTAQRIVDAAGTAPVASTGPSPSGAAAATTVTALPPPGEPSGLPPLGGALGGAPTAPTPLDLPDLSRARSAPAGPAPVTLAFAAPPATAEVIRRPCAEATVVEQKGAFSVVGYVRSSKDRPAVLDEARRRTGGSQVKDRLVALPRGGCDLMTTAARIGTADLPGLAVSLEGKPRQLTNGEKVRLDVTMPGADRYFDVAYLDSEGMIEHLGPRFIDKGAVGERFVYETGYAVKPPGGGEAILVIASRAPVFTTGRPLREPVAAYLDALSRRIGAGLNGTAVRVLVLNTAK